MLPFERSSPRATALAVYRQVLMARSQRQRRGVQANAEALSQSLRPVSLWREALQRARSHPSLVLAVGLVAVSGWALRRSRAGRLAASALGLWRLWRRHRPPPDPR